MNNHDVDLQDMLTVVPDTFIIVRQTVSCIAEETGEEYWNCTIVGVFNNYDIAKEHYDYVRITHEKSEYDKYSFHSAKLNCKNEY